MGNGVCLCLHTYIHIFQLPFYCPSHSTASHLGSLCADATMEVGKGPFIMPRAVCSWNNKLELRMHFSVESMLCYICRLCLIQRTFRALFVKYVMVKSSIKASYSDTLSWLGGDPRSMKDLLVEL